MYLWCYYRMVIMNSIISKKIIVILLLLLAAGSRSQELVDDLRVGGYGGESRIVAKKSITLINGFHATGKVTISISDYPLVTGNPTSSQNYVYTRTFRIPGVTMQNLGDQRLVNEESRSVEYFDERGKATQSVDIMASPGFKDVVNYRELDGFGRETTKYLPYVESSPNAAKFWEDARVYQRKFYSLSGATGSDYKGTDFPFSKTVMEDSPLNRVLEQGAEGENWQPGPRVGKYGHTVMTSQGANLEDDMVKKWEMNGVAGAKTDGLFHDAGSLLKTTLRDENWMSGKAGTVEEYKDLDGKIILERRWKSDDEALDTYHVYNDFGDLSYVIPPKLATAVSITENSNDFNGLVYAYKYDRYGNVVKKKLPGKGWDYFVYNNRHQVVYSRDSEQLGRGEWNFVKYDGLGRIIMSGIEKGHSGDDQASLVSSLASLTISLDEERGTATEGYTNRALPIISANATILAVNYYDRYDAIPAIPFTDHSGFTTALQGLLVANKTRVLGTTDWLWSVSHYDKKGRLVNERMTNHMGGTGEVINTYSFVDELLGSVETQTVGGVTTTITNTHKYDHAGRLEWSKMQVKGQPEIMVAKNEYNAIGQVKKKSLGGTAAGDNFVTAMDFWYNERGWLTSSSAPEFNLSLFYTDPTRNVQPQFNGNIAQQSWIHGSAGRYYTTNYSYDKLNRLTEGNTDGYMREELDYDDMGNINWLKRDGVITNFSYENSGKSNRLLSLTGQIKGNYTYDLNGNATKDRTGMTFTYNHLNLPQAVAGNGTTLSYMYDAGGVKLRKTSSTLGIRDYVGSVEYGANGIERIGFGEGYLLKNGTGFVPYYNLSDHLGNVRAVVYRNPTTGKVEAAQRQDYYPFGKTKGILSGGNNRYLYNGKEVQEELGNQLDYGARFYDAEIARWNVVDPMVEKFPSVSPYGYVENNPVIKFDPNGMESLTRYVGIDGTTLFNTDDGSDDVVVVPWNQTNAFFSEIEDINKTGARQYDTPVWNEHKKELYGVAITEKELYAKGHGSYQTERGRREHVKYLFNSSNTFYLGVNEALGQWAKPEIAIAAVLSAMRGGIAATQAARSRAADLRYAYSQSEKRLAAVVKENSGVRKHIDLFRAVVDDELNDIPINGIRNTSGYATGKLFATTADDAANFGRINFSFDKKPFTIIKTSISTRYLPMLYQGEMDLMQAISVPNNLLNKLPKPTILNNSPLPNHPFLKK